MLEEEAQEKQYDVEDSHVCAGNLYGHSHLESNAGKGRYHANCMLHGF